MADLLKHLDNPTRIRKQFRWAWGIYLINTAVTVLLLFLYPEDRELLRVYLFASVGPLLAQGLLFSQLPYPKQMQRFQPHHLVFVLITLGLFLRGLFGTRQDLYVYLLLGMGPMLITANLYTAMRVRELGDKSD